MPGHFNISLYLDQPRNRGCSVALVEDVLLNSHKF